MNALTVEQLNTYIRDYMANSPVLANVCVKGEISNMRVYENSGHIYFTLKDEKSLLPATMFGGASKLAFKPANGMKVICTGKVSVFVRDGQYRLYADSIIPDGTGELYIAFEQLKQKLQKEGLFDPAHKKPLPKIPFSVGVVTAPGGAAVRDIINIIKRRFKAAQIYLYPSQVQGPSSPPQLITALQALDMSGLCDVIIIGRGGGSAEDLWCFNDEALARAVYSCNTPVISAVGHETDFSICDFVADKRAPTPSAAAELAVPDAQTLKKQFGNAQALINTRVQGAVSNMRRHYELLSSRPVLKSTSAYFDERKMVLSRLDEKLCANTEVRLTASKALLHTQSEKLSGLNPLGVLSRGYSAAFSKDGKIMKNVADFIPGEEFVLRVSDGETKAVAK